MPAQYERIKESYLSKGKDLKEAEKLAAMTYNAHRKPGSTPMGPNYEQRNQRSLLASRMR
jgi:hypothetical protein